ncbi:DUF6538 domain-containing protein [Acuticoccus kalidii]|uniref:DUF6538 domain-containing protein n=1 Tax=Acuticoccus kalidii TaxID=2910977 RepID=UPI0034E2DC92
MRPDTGMILRGTTWYLKVDVPTDVRAEFGRTQVWKSLRTGDLREAKARATTQRAALQSQWDIIREARRPKAQPQPLSDRDIQYAALHVFAGLDVAPEVSPLIAGLCSCCGPVGTGLQTRSG